ncbi:NHLP family bacteriocin export ABC transporter peptidase/permease/ATPase subunit [Oribacterium sp. WCC10]|uniref:NHLP family bacteriocin export ABC transporter peptidase/permease/ATPase subunit n=1 Tax=Oribacterium sp. WCC10 TaxID=1855343 RepID=UPI0008E07C3C|nr:NHLP family bacteriocin export ABC transporter peptidase/permease/ATPase subunit [Oribacterium sp. WCC10]SFG06058.1 NHLM bacteriocin system ABC transporter, peptidase/ATP-binding protein [Oribacterium sp. WCC10]
MSKIKNIPVVMMMENTECGAACLNMILGYYGKWVSLEQVRQDCAVNRDGSNAFNLVCAARNYGLVGGGYRASVDALKNVSVPLILHWNFKHFVVLCGFNKDNVEIIDPAMGKVVVSMEEFDVSYTGVVLKLEPGPDFKKEGHRDTVENFVRSRLQNSRRTFAAAAIFSILVGLGGLISPFISRVYLDYILTGSNEEWFEAVIGFMALTFGFIGIASIVEAIYGLQVEAKLGVNAGIRFMWHVLHLPVEFFKQRYVGDVVQRQESNQKIARVLIKSLAPVFIEICFTIFFVAAMLHYSVALTFLGVFVMFINIVVTQRATAVDINRNRAQLQYKGRIDNTTIAGIEMIETIKASGTEDEYFERWAGLQANYLNYGNTTRGARLEVRLGFLKDIANWAVVIAGAWLILSDNITVGMLLAIQGFLSNASTPLQNLISVGQQFHELSNAINRVEDVMRYKADVPETFDEEMEKAGIVLSDSDKEKGDIEKDYIVENLYRNEEPKKLSGAIEIKNVTFGYSRLSEPFIEDFSLKVPAGGSVAFVGYSGCGKSTMAKLLSGLYKPWSGDILYDGKSIDDIPRDIFTSSLSVVDQDIVLFEDEIIENISLWDKTIEDFDVILAARDAHIHDVIISREGGYRGMIRENGKNFSGGQRQRIEIARALAEDPTVLILDEATSALDAETEYKVMESIKKRGISIIVIAHRLSTIRECDEIIVMDNGKIMERGTHDELMARSGRYRQLIMME